MTRGSVIRGVAVLAVAALTAGGFALSPATSATKFLTKKKARKLFYTKAAADARFLRVDQSLAVGVERSVGPPGIELDPMRQEVVDLQGLHDGGDDKRLSVPFPGRIMASSTLYILNQDTLALDSVACLLFISGATEPIGLTAWHALPNRTSTVQVTGSVNVSPGQYDLSLECEEAAPSDLVLIGASLFAWVLPS